MDEPDELPLDSSPDELPLGDDSPVALADSLPDIDDAATAADAAAAAPLVDLPISDNEVDIPMAAHFFEDVAGAEVDADLARLATSSDRPKRGRGRPRKRPIGEPGPSTSDAIVAAPRPDAQVVAVADAPLLKLADAERAGLLRQVVQGVAPGGALQLQRTGGYSTLPEFSTALVAAGRLSRAEPASCDPESIAIGRELIGLRRSEAPDVD